MSLLHEVRRFLSSGLPLVLTFDEPCPPTASFLVAAPHNASQARSRRGHGCDNLDDSHPLEVNDEMMHQTGPSLIVKRVHDQEDVARTPVMSDGVDDPGPNTNGDAAETRSDQRGRWEGVG